MVALSNVRKSYKRNKEVYTIYGLLLFFIILSTVLDGNFLSIKNLTNIFTTNMPFIIAAYAQTIAILIGGVDLSIGASISLVTCICATTGIGDSALGVLPGIVLSLLVSMVIGLINGILVTKFNIQALIGTLAVSLVLNGCSLAILDKPGGSIAKEFAKPFASDEMLFAIFIIITIGLWLLLNRTRLGKSIYAVGGNSLFAYSAGISVDRTKIRAFILSGALTGLAGIMLACSMRSGDPTAGDPLTLKALTAAVIGGASFAGGSGRIECTFAGVMIFSIINNILNLSGVSTFYQYVAQGVLLIFAIAITSRRK